MIAYDIQFTEQTQPREDNALIEAVDRTDGVVLATTEVDKGGRTAVFGGDRVLRAIGAKPGSSNFDNDEDGVIRRMPYEVDGAQELRPRGRRRVPGRRAAGREGGVRVHRLRRPAGDRGHGVLLPAGRTGARRPGTFKDKIVVVGATASSLQDVHATPVGEGRVMAGPEIQANSIATALGRLPAAAGARRAERGPDRAARPRRARGSP